MAKKLAVAQPVEVVGADQILSDPTNLATFPGPKEPKTFSVTLHSGDVTLTLVAVRAKDKVSTFATTRTAGAKTTTRGNSATHDSWERATQAINEQAALAVRKGWTRRLACRGFVARKDAFDGIPSIPVAGKVKK